jgi:hypothetical protein
MPGRSIFPRPSSPSAHPIQQLSEIHPQTTREARQHAHAWIALTALDATNVREGEAAGVGYLLLGEAAFGADSEDVSAEAVEGIAGHGGIVVAWGRSALELISLATG